MKKILLILLIVPVLGVSQEVETPPEVLFCDEMTKLFNSNYNTEHNNSDRTASEKEENLKWHKLIYSYQSAIENNGVLYGEKIGWREVEGGVQNITWMSVMSKNCEAFKKILEDLDIEYEATSEVIKYEDMENED